LFGKAGDDILRGGSGDDLLDGGKGSDTALFDGVLADYGVAENLVTHLATGEADTLLNIERLRFSDSDLLLV
ncbi:MAG TPA: alkaline metalloproteinase, partial [Vicinamibacterales bacterium]|nr:alkaline metalloproteinase [Vicinamibacterales bacterium]